MCAESQAGCCAPLGGLRAAGPFWWSWLFLVCASLSTIAEAPADRKALTFLLRSLEAKPLGAEAVQGAEWTRLKFGYKSKCKSGRNWELFDSLSSAALLVQSFLVVQSGCKSIVFELHPERFTLCVRLSRRWDVLHQGGGLVPLNLCPLVCRYDVLQRFLQ